METFSVLLILCKGNPPVTSGFPSQGQWHRALMFSLISTWRNGWANNQDGDELRCWLLAVESCKETHITYVVIIWEWWPKQQGGMGENRGGVGVGGLDLLPLGFNPLPLPNYFLPIPSPFFPYLFWYPCPKFRFLLPPPTPTHLALAPHPFFIKSPPTPVPLTLGPLSPLPSPRDEVEMILWSFMLYKQQRYDIALLVPESTISLKSCLFNSLFSLTIKEISTLHFWSIVRVIYQWLVDCLK